MQYLQIQHTIKKHFPISLQNDLERLPEEGQIEFLDQFRMVRKSVGLSYLFHFIVGSSYLYQGKWFKQILFWLTGFYFGFGFIINLIRMPQMVEQVNLKIARKIVKGLYHRYRIHEEPASGIDARHYIKNKQLQQTRQGQVMAKTKPRNAKPPYDPTNLTVANLETGFMLDYDFKTWDVLNENQFDWFNGHSESEFKLATDLEQVYINVRKDNEQFRAVRFNLISIYALGNRLEAEIALRGKPSNVLEYQGRSFFREMQKEGLAFSITKKSFGKKVIVWEYLDHDRKEMLRIEQYGKDFRTFYGSIVSMLAFTDILPKNVYG